MPKVAKTKENLKKCRCNSCPSYTMGCKMKNYPLNFIKMIDGLNNVEHFEGMFCAYGSSNCIEENRGCLCNDCAVFHENQLNRDEYCISTVKNTARCRGAQCRA